MEVVRWLLVVVILALPGLAVPIGVVVLNRMRRRPNARQRVRVLAFFFLFYTFNVAELVVWASLLAPPEHLPPSFPLVSFVIVQAIGVWASYVAVRDA
jgi:hypothetical protein